MTTAAISKKSKGYKTPRLPHIITKEEYDRSGAWGLYTYIDVYDCNPRKIESEKAIREFTVELCKLLKVNRAGDMTLMLFGDRPEIYGWSMSQMIETSLVAGHFIQKTNTAFLDIFSCKYYDITKAIPFSLNFFEGSSFNYHSALRKSFGRYSSAILQDSHRQPVIKRTVEKNLTRIQRINRES